MYTYPSLSVYLESRSPYAKLSIYFSPKIQKYVIILWRTNQPPNEGKDIANAQTDTLDEGLSAVDTICFGILNR
jgi:hypothetical protein